MAYVVTKSDLKNSLMNANRTYDNRQSWQNMYSSIDMSRQNALASTNIDYSDAMSQAYISSFNQQQAIANSNLGQGYQQAYLNDTNNALQEAYNTYRQNYLQQTSAIQENAAGLTGQIDNALDAEAENYKKVSETGYGYLNYLFEYYNNGDGIEGSIFDTDPYWNKYVNNNDGDYSLKTWEEIMKAPGSKDINGNFDGFFDDKGNITYAGMNFYDQMFNYSVGKTGMPSYDTYLSETDPKLREWLTTADAYNYNEAGTKFGTFKTLIGMKSRDDTYDYIDRITGLDQSTFDKVFGDIQSELDKINAEAKRIKYNKDDDADAKKADNTAKMYKKLGDNITKLCNELGITNQLNDDLGMSISDYIVEQSNYSTTKSYTDTGSSVAITVGNAATAAGAIGGTAAIALGAASGPVGWIALGIGGLATAIAGAIAQNDSKTKNVKLNKNSISNLQNNYDALVKALVSYAQDARTNAKNNINVKKY